MAPKAKNTKQATQTLNHQYRRTANINKSKTFLTRINYEKRLPFKKRLFSIEFKITKQRCFQPMPYEKPVTRSQQRRCSTLSSTNEETEGVQFEDAKKRKITGRNRKQNGKLSMQRNIQHENSMSAMNDESLNRLTADVAASGNGANICAIL